MRKNAAVISVARAAPSGLRRRGVALVVVVYLLLLLAIAIDSSGAQGAVGSSVAVCAATAACLALPWRRSHPELMTAVSLMAGLVLQLVRPELDWPVPALITVATLAASRPPQTSLWGLAGLWVVALLGLVDGEYDDVFVACALATTSWALGEGKRNRRLRRDEERLRAVVEERTRIARELHDVIAHNVSVIVVQAAAGAAVFDKRPERSRQALVSVEAVGRHALAELRRLLTLPDLEASTGPAPGLDHIEELIAGVRAAGLEVELRHVGKSGPLPAEVDLSAYRIVQESLTNTLRHARATRVSVLLRWSAACVELDVIDDGTAAPQVAGSGRGLAGMRDRAVALGGTLTAGPQPAGGFRVHALLPRQEWS